MIRSIDEALAGCGITQDLSPFSHCDRRRLIAGLALVPLLTRPALGAPLASRPEPSLSFPRAEEWDPPIAPTQERMISGPNGALYVRSYGRAGAASPVIILHGGPAAGHRYMRPYARLAEERQTIFYDQSGCGRSARPPGLAYYTVDRYVSELEAVRDAMGARRIVLLGHSWGGMLALAYAAAYPAHVAGLVLAGTAARMADFQEAAHRWLAALGPDALDIAATDDRGGAPSPPLMALQESYYRAHLLRLAPWPDWFLKVLEEIGSNPVYRYLNGPSEFEFTGALRTLDLSRSLASLRAPTLVTCGEFDEAPPWIGRKLAGQIAGAQFLAWPGLSHMSHIEAPSTVVPATARFLRSVETVA